MLSGGFWQSLPDAEPETPDATQATPNVEFRETCQMARICLLEQEGF